MPADQSKPRRRNAKRRSGRRLRLPAASRPAAELHAYSSSELKKLFDLSASFVESLIEDGFIRPEQAEGRVLYSFQDLTVLRTASALRSARIPVRRIRQALNKLRESLPESALNSLALAPAGDDIAVREGVHLWQFDSGQYALPLSFEPAAPRVSALTPPEAAQAVETLFLRALDLEEQDAVLAEQVYRQCLQNDPEHLESRINLGRLLHLAGDLQQAEAIYRGAGQPSALLHFNLAVVLEDLSREGEALTHYAHAITLDPSLSDAHFNLARLHEQANQPRDALRHLIAYRRLLAMDGK